MQKCVDNPVTPLFEDAILLGYLFVTIGTHCHYQQVLFMWVCESAHMPGEESYGVWSYIVVYVLKSVGCVCLYVCNVREANTRITV